MMTRSKLYAIAAIACTAGYAWLLFSFRLLKGDSGVDLCPLHLLSGIPCPACGTTRSILAIWTGHPAEAWHWNPLGFIFFCLMIIVPIWLLWDLLRKSDSFLRAYLQGERFLERRPVAILAITLVLANWIWNINKQV